MIETEKIYTCKYDRVFKEIFAKEENKDILIKLLESILKVKIEKVEYLNLERNVDNVNVARKHLDLFLKTDVGKIQVEVNATDKDYVKPRNMAYLCDIYSHHTLKGEIYNEETMMIQINFSYGISIDEYVREYRIQDNVFIYATALDAQEKQTNGIFTISDKFKSLYSKYTLSKKDDVITSLKSIKEQGRAHFKQQLQEYIDEVHSIAETDNVLYDYDHVDHSSKKR